MIGISKPPNSEIHTIKLWFTHKQTPYIQTKPIHGTQKNTQHDDDSSTVTIEIIPNFELEQLILSYGERCEVLEPEWLRERIKNRLKTSIQNYMK